MAALSNADRELIWQRLMKRWSSAREPVGFTKPELRAAVDAIDDWIDANAAQINQALPTAFRTSATPAQKALLLSYVAMKRYGDDPRRS